MNQIQIIEIASELGAGTRGASLGLRALKAAGEKYKSALFHKHNSINIPDKNQLLGKPSSNPNAKYIDGIFDILQSISKSVCKVLQENNFPVVLSGDHSNAAGTIAGIRHAKIRGEIGIIWIDAHADLHSPYTTPSGNVHGMPLAMVLNEDNLENKINQPSNHVVQIWNKIKNLCCPNAPVKPENIVFVSVRDIEMPEHKLIEENNIRNITVDELRESGAAEMGAECLKILQHCDDIYVSFDVDSLDPSISLGTGTPVPNGLMLNEVEDLLDVILKSKKVCCFEMVEVNPLLDQEKDMAECVFPVLEKSVELIRKSRG